MKGDRVRLTKTREFGTVYGPRIISEGERGDVEEVSDDDVYINWDCGGGTWCDANYLEEIGSGDTAEVEGGA